MEWSRRIYGYCERGFFPGVGTDAFWAEPLNAVTNAAFIIAAIIGLLLAVRARRLDGPVAWLILLTFAVGVGSFLFHTYAVVWAAMTDTIPIMLFILSYFAIAMRCYAGFSWGKSVVLVVAFLATLLATSYFLRAGVDAFRPPVATDAGEGDYLEKLMLVGGVVAIAFVAWIFVVLQLLGTSVRGAVVLGVAYYAMVIVLSEVMQVVIPEIFPGARSYMPALFALAGIGFWLAGRGHPAGQWLIGVAVVFTLSLTARALDRPLCAHFLIGTHWLWHVLNGIVLGSLIVALIRHGRIAQDVTRSA